MKASRKTLLALIGAMAIGAAIAAPSVEIVSVQQQYPWTNTVDIVYNVAGVESETNGYFVVFTPTTSDGKEILDVNGQKSVQVALKGSGVYSTQWYPQTNLQYTACKMTPSVFRGQANDYMIIDLATGAIAYEPMATQAASNERYNTDEYKTTKMVFRKVVAGSYPVRRKKSGVEYGTTADMGKDYYITIFDVTEAQYNRIKDTAPYTDMRPKTGVSCNTLRGGALAKANVVPSATGDVIARLNYKTGLSFDLPNLAMSQVAIHANASQDWPCFWGELGKEVNTYCVYAENSNKTLQNVGSLGNGSANPWGIFDAYGNVEQMCRDAASASTFATTGDALGADNDDISLTQVPTQTGTYAVNIVSSNTSAPARCRTCCISRDRTKGSVTASIGFRLALIVE